MHTKDILKLSLKNLKTHLGRNLMLMVVSGVIFMLIFMVNLWLQGLENTYQKYASEATDGKVIVAASNVMNSISAADETAAPTATKAEITADLERFGAKIVGEREFYGVYGSVILNADLVSGAVEIDPALTPKDSAPLLVSSFLGQQLLGTDYTSAASSARNKAESYHKYRSEIIGKTLTDTNGERYYVVGLSPSGFGINNLSFKGIDRKSGNPLNAILEMISTPSATPLVLASSAADLPPTNSTPLDSLAGVVPLLTLPSDEQSVVAVFEDGAAAYRYFKSGKGQFMGVEQKGRTYSVSTLAGMSPETKYIFQVIKTIATIVCIVLAVVALVVTIFTSIRLIDQDKQNIALYYSLGATKRQVKAIYLCYFFELAVGALILATLVAVGITIGCSVLNRETLGVLFMVAFSLPKQPEVILCGMNLAIYGFALLLVANPLFCIIGIRSHLYYI